MVAGRAGRTATRTVAAVRVLPLAGSVLWRQLTEDPVRAAVLAHRVTPPWVKIRLNRVLARAGPLGHALVRWDEAGEVSLQLDSRPLDDAPPPRALRRLAAFALAVGRPDAARAMLARMPGTDPARRRLRARLARLDGDLYEAASLLRTPRECTTGRAPSRMLRAIEGELAVLRGNAARGRARPVGRGIGGRTETLPEPVPGRVLHLVTNALPHANAGYTIRTQRVAAAQRADGVDAHVATRLGFPVTRGSLDGRHRVDIDGVPYHRLLPRLLPATADVALGRGIDLAGGLVERLRPSVLHAASDHVNAQVALALRARYGIPVVYEVRGFLEESWLSRTAGRTAGCDRYRLSRMQETRCMREADAVVTLGAAMAEEIIGRGVAADKVTVVPNAVDEAFLQPSPDAADLRARWGIPGDAFVVGTVSTFYGYEGLDVLVRAAADLRGRGEPVWVLLVGDGPELPRLRRLVAETGLDETVIFPGRVPHAEVRRYYSALDVFAVPRTGHRVCHLVTPLKPVEAMASGLPVVASELPALRELVEPDVTGGLIPPEYPHALADYLQQLLYSPNKRKKMGQAARDVVARDRTWRAVAARYRTIYAALGVFPGVR